MPQITFGGSNPAAQGVPDLFVQVQQPPAGVLPGAPSNLLGVVGTATWGPVDAPVILGDIASAVAAFGAMQARKYDLVTAISLAAMQGANAFYGVRRTDGTDVAASVVVQSTCITFTAKYTGSRGNGLKATLATGTAPNTTKLVVSMPGLPSETFDNIPGSANALWVAMAAAVNSGQGPARGPSQLITATAGAGTTAPTLATSSLTGGTDGATTITSTVMLGSDGSPRTGLYALRGTGCAAVMMADADDSTVWPSQLAYAKSELCEAFAVSPAGDTITAFTTAINTAAVDDPWITVLFGDWLWFVDAVNNVTRLVSPQAVKAGAKLAAGPANSVLNRPVYGVAGSQTGYANKVYSTAELQLLSQARGDLITAPSVGGAYLSCRFGRNASSDPGRHSDTYTTMTNYLARSMALGLGQFVGRLITKDEMREAAATIGGFLENEKQSGRIDSYSVQIDGANNPPTQIALGVQKATVLVRYLSVLEYFVVDLTGGQTVTPLSTLAA